MDAAQVQAWLAVISIAATVGEGLVNAIKSHAQQTLTPEEYAQLELAWNADVAESAKNAGIAPEPDVPLDQS